MAVNRILITNVSLIILLLTIQGVAEIMPLGPMNISFNMAMAPEPYVITGDSFSTTYVLGDKNVTDTVYPMTLGHRKNILIQLHHLDVDADVGSNNIESLLSWFEFVPSGWSIESQPLKIDGHQGTMVNATSPSYAKIYLAGYSPDEVDGEGQVLLLMGARMCFHCSKYFFQSVRMNV